MRKKNKPFRVVFTILVVAVAMVGTIVGIQTFKNLFFPAAYQDLVHKYSNRYGLDEYLVMAVIKTESNFIPDAHSGKASGLMQLTDDTAEWVCEKLDIDEKKINLFNPSDNIKLGCYYLKHLLKVYDGNVDVVLAAYNGGPGNVNKWLLDERYSKDGEELSYIPFKETREYVERVNKQWEIYKELYAENEKNKRKE